MGFEDAFRGRLAEAVRAAGGPTAIAERSGVPKTTITNWTSGSAEPKIRSLTAVAQACGVSIDWLVGHSDPISGVSESSDSVNDFSFIRRYDVRASAGPGAIVPFDDLNGTSRFVAFRTEWLHRIGVNPGGAEVLIAVGDSMEPTIRDGDLLLIDRSFDRITAEGIYVLVLAERVLVKRIVLRRDGSAILRSDSDHVPDETVPAHEVEELRVEGRVRWFGRTI
ncbi:S24 family peptidase [Xanthobacteraceae bacterium Astr-EGSB]|uniref:XRE family transcriptional regulator n=1 Tax=Astrobacterium formosum TaxID=3069710 RepID=UPI0027B2D015|nr:S24 family peptidase [Xanthobacteraceae bacterium Astr-EGSB]